MPTFIYRCLDNVRVPSVTTINRIGQESGGLIHWAWLLGMDNKDYRTERDAAAEGGTVGHALVEAAVSGTDANLSDFTEDAQKAGAIAFDAYKEWRSQTHIDIVKSEVPLVSERHRFGGCIDAICTNKEGKFCLADFKTGAIYDNHLCQVAAYKALWDENHPDQTITAGFHLCRFNRTTGDFAHHYFADLSDAWKAFLLKRELYDLLAKLKKRV